MEEKKKKLTPFAEKVWLAVPHMHNGEELRYVTAAYNDNWMSTVGENIDVIEKEAAERVGVRYAVALSAGTSALHLCVKLAGVKRGDPVLVSALTFSATVNPIVYEGGVPVFVDAEYDTWNMDPRALERAFAAYPRAKVVVTVNLYGTPGKLDALKAVCDAHGAVLIEDAAESFGATYKGRQTGSFGKYNAISFNGNKIITGSSGGMLLTDDKAAADRARKWSTQSRDAAPWYQHTELGYNYRMSNVIAGVVRGQLPHLDEHIAMKKAIYQRYQEGFRGLPVTMNPYDEVNSEPNFWLSCLLIDESAMCPQERSDTEARYRHEAGKTCPTEILETLARCNAEGRPIWKPMQLQPLFRGNDYYTAGETDVSEDLFRRGLCLPSSLKMTPRQQEKVIEIVRSCFD